ncbi:CobW family GTP-binding protein [Halogranum rubrum]|uniref:Cobalamin synthesis protein/P47K n=1 Tax=Halogranum salarium B-1 TaxID=1210908 RepID=J2ZH29_9EURY|nr:GTP-binding protein [Halogranum salarium]EJN60005.1 cobalamin synthesis protein/P47K [Halogranum salarium B-1]
MARDAIPVTILSGSLGAGKTTLLNHLLHTADRDIAVLVNDMGEVNIDAALVSDSSELDVDDGVTELSNGCICCELQDDLNTAVVRLARERDFDHLVVESSGISEPEPVARLFTTGSRAAALYEVDSLVTVVDARLFYDTFGGDEGVKRRGTADDGTRPLSDLLVEQVEFSNVVLLNKRDLLSEDELDTVEELVRTLRPDAVILRSEFGQVAAGELLGRGLYDPATAADAAGWKQALNEDDADEREDAHGDGHTHDGNSHGDSHDGHDHAGHSHPDEMYGVTSFVYRRRRPFQPQRLERFLSSLPDSVVRSKGTCWVAGNDHQQVMGQAGPSVRVEAGAPWVASLPELDQELYRSNRKNLEWDDEWGDRKTELVFIGQRMDEEKLVDALDDCLLTDAEMDGEWTFEDPFPQEQGESVVVAEPTV